VKSEKQKVKINLLLTQKKDYFCKNHSKMNKNLLYIALRWGAIIGILQIISICLQVYFFQDALSSLTKGTKIATLLISFCFIYCAIYEYKKTFDSSKPFPLLQAVYVGVLASLFFTVIFILLFFLVKLIDSSNPIFVINAQLINDLQYLNLYFFAVAIILAVFMQRKEEDTEHSNNENK